MNKFQRNRAVQYFTEWRYFFHFGSFWPQKEFLTPALPCDPMGVSKLISSGIFLWVANHLRPNWTQTQLCFWPFLFHSQHVLSPSQFRRCRYCCCGQPELQPPFPIRRWPLQLKRALLRREKMLNCVRDSIAFYLCLVCFFSNTSHAPTILFMLTLNTKGVQKY